MIAADSQEIRLYATKEQLEVINCNARMLGFFACRRFGKTDTFLNRCIKQVMERPQEYLYVSPDYGLAKEQYGRLCEYLEPWIVRAVEQPKPMIRLLNGSRVHLRSFDRPRRLKGLRRIAEIWVDEIQEIYEDQFWKVLRPMISDMRGTLVVSGQFEGENWAFKKFYQPGQKPDQNYAKSWAFNYRQALIYQTDGGLEEVLAAKEQMTPEQFDEMYECKPASNPNHVFKSRQVDRISTELRPQIQVEPEPLAGGPYITCIDIGGLADDQGLIVGNGAGDIVFSRLWEARQGLDDRQLARESMDVASLFGGIVVVDATGGGKPGGSDAVDEERVEFYRQDAAKMGLDFREVYQGRNKERLVLNLRTAIQEQNIRIAAELTTVCDQLKKYEFSYHTPTKSYKYQGPGGKEDEYVSCCMMFREAMNRNWIKRASGGHSIGAMFA